MTLEGLHHFTIVYPDGFTEEWRPRVGGVKSSYIGMAVELLELAGLHLQLQINHMDDDPEEIKDNLLELGVSAEDAIVGIDQVLVTPHTPAAASEVLAARDSTEVEESGQVAGSW